TESGSRRSARAISRYSASEATPVGAAPAYETFGCGLNPAEYAMGTSARRSARSNALAKSRCDVKRSRPRLAYRMRSRWTTGGGGGPSGCLAIVWCGQMGQRGATATDPDVERSDDARRSASEPSERSERAERGDGGGHR